MERVVEVEKEVEVERLVHVEKEVGVRNEEVEKMRRDLELQARAIRAQFAQFAAFSVAAPPLLQAERDRHELLDQQLQQREQKMALNQQLASCVKEIHAARDEQIRAAHRLEQLQAKLVHGGENLLDKSARLAAEEAAKAEQLAEQRAREQEMQKRMEEEEEARLGLEEKYSSLQEEVEGKGRKLKKLWTKYKAAQSEIRDVQAEFSREKEDILETVRELSRQLKLKQLIMSTYIPLEQLSKIERRSEWDEDRDLADRRLQYAGNPMRAKRRSRRARPTRPPTRRPPPASTPPPRRRCPTGRDAGVYFLRGGREQDDPPPRRRARRHADVRRARPAEDEEQAALDARRDSATA